MDDITRAELELISLKVRRSMEAADRGELRQLTDNVIDEILAKAAKRHAEQGLLP